LFPNAVLPVVSSVQGGFLLGKNEPAFTDEERRINYFQSHHHSETTLQYADEAVINHSVLSTIMRLLHRTGVDVVGDSLSGIEWAEQEFSACCFNAIRSRICERFDSMTKLEKMTLLAGLSKELNSMQRPVALSVNRNPLSVPNYLQDLLSQLNEIIVLVEEAENEEEGAFRKDLSQLFSEWVYNAAIVGAAVQTRRSDDSNRFSPLGNASSTVDGIAPHVRGQLTDAMLNVPSTVDESHFNALAPCILFSLMQDRVVISREECFEAFVKSCKGDSSLEDLCSAFAFGIHQLCYCGLVNEKLGSKNNVLYERSALVWCSGS